MADWNSLGMVEYSNVRQHPGERRRRWFHDEEFELVVWFEEPDQIVRFELSYDIQRNWRALRWSDSAGFSHHTVDDGEDRPHRNATPLLRATTEAPPAAMFGDFESHCASLDPPIRAFIRSKLAEYKASLGAL